MRTQDLLDIVQAELRNQLGLAVLRAEPLHHLQGPNSTLLRARLTLHTSEVFDVWIKKARVGDHLRHRIANDFNVTDFLYRERIRLDRVSEANHDLSRLLDKPGAGCAMGI